MSEEPLVLFEVQGVAADHLYREGSAHASFWEALFGSSLRAKKRAQVSALADGTKMFDVPLLTAEDDLLRSARSWMSAPERFDSCQDALAALTTTSVRVKLIGTQPKGHSIARFVLQFKPSGQAPPRAAAIASALRSWFAAEGGRATREILIPFGFTPHTS